VSIRIGVHTTGRAELRAHLVAVHAGQQDVEHDRVVRVLLRHPQAVDAVGRDVGREPLRLETPTHALGEHGFVFDHEHPHVRSPASSCIARLKRC
jgi:hypothetical protein